MKNKICSAQDAVALILDGDSLITGGFVGIGVAEVLLKALEDRYVKTGHPKNLTLMFAAGQGDGKERGLNHLAHEGLVTKVIGGHFGLIPKIGKLLIEEKMEGYNLPQGIISHLYRDIAAGKPGVLTKVGLGTFVDPRMDGGKINTTTKEDLVEIMKIKGEEWLFYNAFPLKAAIIRGTSADGNGNITMEKEALTLDSLSMAMAVKNSGGIVIAQVERICENGSLNPRNVEVPGILVDAIVVASPESGDHEQTFNTHYSPAYSGEIRVPLSTLATSKMPLNERKIIARRASFLLPMNGVINLGIGLPEGVATVCNEEHILNHFTLTAEPGLIGGLPANGLDFGAGCNMDAIIHQALTFDFYDGKGLDLACLGLAECDEIGNVNVSRFGTRLAGAGGFINISQNAGVVVFVGTFTAGGLKIKVQDGKLEILNEGRAQKFVKSVQQVTFSGKYAASNNQTVYYVTERCVFRLAPADGGLQLVEIAPGIDIEKNIIAHMGFRPIIDTPPRTMDSRIFKDESMDLQSTLVKILLPDRIHFDSKREILFLNFSNLHVRSFEDVQDIRKEVGSKYRLLGGKVPVIVNYDGFEIDNEAFDSYAELASEFTEKYYKSVTRYTTSAFMRMKLGKALSDRGLKPHIYETQEECDKMLSV